jgi:hypothetical protein
LILTAGSERPPRRFGGRVITLTESVDTVHIAINSCVYLWTCAQAVPANPTGMIAPSGRGAAWLAHWSGGPGVAGSNPAVPTPKRETGTGPARDHR